MEWLTALLGIPGVSLGGKVLAPIMILWALGQFRGSAPYKGLRSALGKFSENLGESISRLGNSKLRWAYEPLEALFLDFGPFMFEQLGVGMRKDNPSKDLPAQLERLEGVGSEARAEAIRKKMEQFVKESANAKVQQ